VALLQRIQEEDPELWETITQLPDGIRSTIKIASVDVVDAEADRFIQAALEIEAAQIPLMSPSSQVEAMSPFDNPQQGETLVLFESGGTTESYAVGNDTLARSITSSQLISAMECPPDTPAEPIAPNTNDRVMAAFEVFKADSLKKLGRGRRPGGDTRIRRYLSRHLNIARQQYKDDSDELRRIDVLRQIFLGYLPARVSAALRDIRDLRLEGIMLIRRLEALRGTYRLNPPDEEDEQPDQVTRVIRTVCSDGLIG
jgi:hypothetical protein